MPNSRRIPAQAPANERRRTVLKFGLFGVGAFVLGKVLGPSINLFGSSMEGDVHDFKNFRVVENSKGLGFFDKLGNEILILENDGKAGK